MIAMSIGICAEPIGIDLLPCKCAIGVVGVVCVLQEREGNV